MDVLPVRLGDVVTFAKTVGETDVYLFAGISGDFGTNHINQAHMEKTPYGARIAHGAMLLAFVSAASTKLVERLPANHSLTPVNLGYDRIRFIKAVYIGDTITVAYKVDAIDTQRFRATCRAEITNQNGALVAVAENLLKWVPLPTGPVAPKDCRG
jgi:3-hydroxybutyryl-CoA dehydratase